MTGPNVIESISKVEDLQGVKGNSVLVAILLLWRDHGNSYKTRQLIDGLFTISEAQSIIIMAGSMVLQQ